MSIVAARWIDLASSVDPALATDEPLGADVMQVAAAVGTYAARVLSTRVLWEHPGDATIGGDVGWNDRPESFPWGTDPAAADAVWMAFAGMHRLRRHGEGGRYPSVTLTARIAAPAGNDAGLILVARPTMGRPGAADAYGTVTSSATSLTTKSITLAIPPSAVGVRMIAPALGTTYPVPEPVESGSDTVVALYVGAWKGGAAGAGKVTIRGLTLYLEAP